MNPICPYCGQVSEKVGGAKIYPHRQDLYAKWFYLCAPCDAYVGCHPNTDMPLGRLANAELRKAKSAAHASFDPLWRNKIMDRSDAYIWLAKALGIKRKNCHIGMFDVQTCQRVVEVVNDRA